MINGFAFDIFHSMSLNLSIYRHHLLTCSVSISAELKGSIIIGDTGSWFHDFCTAKIGEDCCKFNNCIIWNESKGIYRAIYIDKFCKFGDVVLYSSAVSKSPEHASFLCVEAWKQAKKEIINIADS